MFQCEMLLSNVGTSIFGRFSPELLDSFDKLSDFVFLVIHDGLLFQVIRLLCLVNHSIVIFLELGT